MKPGSFAYVAPETLDEALVSLKSNGDEAKVLAGGQSLVPAMNLRLSTPAVLVDINRIPGYGGVEEMDGALRVGMLARHSAFEDLPLRDPLGGLLSRISRQVGHLPIRLRGTFAGSLAHADPAAEWCALVAALDATIQVRSVRGERSIEGSAFFKGLFTTALADDEIITKVRIPLLGRAGWGFHEQSKTAGDFATVAALATLALRGREVMEARIGLAGVDSTPVRAVRAEDLLQGAPAEPGAMSAAAEIAAEDIDPVSDANCSADYRRHLVRVLLQRALQNAVGRAT
jgi:carbon-monoxide dehydrogenase medium subunit